MSSCRVCRWPGRKERLQPSLCCSDHLDMLPHFSRAVNRNYIHFQAPLNHLGHPMPSCQRHSLHFAFSVGLSCALLSCVSCSFAMQWATPQPHITVFCYHPLSWSNSPSDPLFLTYQGAGNIVGSIVRVWEPFPSSVQQQRSKIHVALIHPCQPAAPELNKDFWIQQHTRVLCRQPGPALPLSHARALALGTSAGMVAEASSLLLRHYTQKQKEGWIYHSHPNSTVL